MNCLVDTNIFLEILLNQSGRKKCEAFLQGDLGAAWISDFSLHSIGVLLFRQFAADTLPQFTVLSLSAAGYAALPEASNRFGLDFDDAYQFCTAQENHLTIATQDKDFLRVREVANVRLL